MLIINLLRGGGTTNHNKNSSDSESCDGIISNTGDDLVDTSESSKNGDNHCSNISNSNDMNVSMNDENESDTEVISVSESTTSFKDSKQELNQKQKLSIKTSFNYGTNDKPCVIDIRSPPFTSQSQSQSSVNAFEDSIVNSNSLISCESNKIPSPSGLKYSRNQQPPTFDDYIMTGIPGNFTKNYICNIAVDKCRIPHIQLLKMSKKAILEVYNVLDCKINRDYVVNILANQKLIFQSFETLFGNKWINDEVINFTYNILKMRSHMLAVIGYNKKPDFYCNSFLVTMLMGKKLGTYNFKDVSRWTRCEPFKSFFKGYVRIYFPVNESKIYWMTFPSCFQRKIKE